MSATLAELALPLDVFPDAIVVVDATGRIIYANAAIHTLLGYESGELVGESISRLVPERFREAHARQVSAYAVQGKPRPMGSRPLLFALHKCGSELPVSISLSPLEVEGRHCSIAVLRDASRFQRQLGQMMEQAERDALTGLGNRVFLTRKLASSIPGSFALLYLDLAKFKAFNDRYGHRIGDEVLRVVARRIEGTVRATDTAIRLGGDEFVVLLEGLTDADQIAARALAIADSIGKPVRVDSIVGEIAVNIGGAIFPAQAASGEELLERADQAMYQAKQLQQVYRLYGSAPLLESAV